MTDILIVEDNPHDLELTLNALRGNNLANRIEVARDGEEALDFLFGKNSAVEAGNLPRAILLDIKLPKVDGLDVLRAIRSNERTRHIPVVLLTSSAEEQDMLTGYELGVNSYVVKPVEFGAFSKAVSDLGLYWLMINKPLTGR